jgi:hypothetical protein
LRDPTKRTKKWDPELIAPHVFVASLRKLCCEALASSTIEPVAVKDDTRGSIREPAGHVVDVGDVLGGRGSWFSGHASRTRDVTHRELGVRACVEYDGLRIGERGLEFRGAELR